MQNFLANKLKCFLPFIFFLMAFFVFQKNIFNTVNKDFFDSFQKDSEALVVGGIVADELGIEKNAWGLGFIGMNGEFQYPNNIMDSYEAFSNKEKALNAIYSPYVSQVGGLGVFYSTLQKVFSFKSISRLQYFPSAIFAFLVVAFYYLHRRIYGARYALIFSLVLVLSPWVVSFARNLYWSPFMWLLPLFFGTLAYAVTSPKVRIFFYFLIFISFFAKCLSGYEYITSITLLACSPFMLGPFFNGESKPCMKPALIVFVLCVLGFICAFVIHAKMRGETIAEGVVAIYKQDVKRRTYSDPSNFDAAYAESLSTSPIAVVKTYVTSWRTPLVAEVSGKSFKVLIIIAILGLWIKKKIKHKTFVRDFALIAYMSLIPLSWYVMAKGHSHIHTHMNYVLWYLGFVPALFYVCVNAIVVTFKAVPQYIKSLNP
ncbi:hypothetical protein ACIKP9_09355 [Methylobacillus methanolivorans]|uniref:Glycosyltransferase RgtA/B/C/D-like domain-containing protein n=1 Tax=Methylobacillus methanolivorans TaxID=1848927 RepID=A0ABW8GNE2_9PROT